MKKVVLDTSFILTCVKQKIDFFEKIKFMGMQILIPKQVIREMKSINNSNSELSFKILKKNKFKEIDLGKGKVDNLLINFAKENKEVIVATLDREIKKKTPNSKLVIRGKKNLKIL
jgi:hypothetical protein